MQLLETRGEDIIEDEIGMRERACDTKRKMGLDGHLIMQIRRRGCGNVG